MADTCESLEFLSGTVELSDEQLKRVAVLLGYRLDRVSLEQWRPTLERTCTGCKGRSPGSRTCGISIAGPVSSTVEMSSGCTGGRVSAHPGNLLLGQPGDLEHGGDGALRRMGTACDDMGLAMLLIPTSAEQSGGLEIVRSAARHGLILHSLSDDHPLVEAARVQGILVVRIGRAQARVATS